MSQQSAHPLTPVNQTREWQQLQAHYGNAREFNLAALFQQEPDRHARFSLEAAGLMLDFSRNFVTEETLSLLLALAERCGLPGAIEAMFAGKHVNPTEDRPALHTALRSPREDTPEEQAVQSVLRRMADFVSRVHSGQWRGYSGQAVTDVVNIGIGGSDLGPAMAYRALAPYHAPGLRCRFVSNVDPAHLAGILAGLNPETTLFIVASKSFTTLETSENARSARRWMLAAMGDETLLARHFVAVTANGEKARAFGIDADNIFPMWDWVGGRYSLWSAIGLPLALGVGMDNFKALLAGGHAMDEHFRTAPAARNMPVIMALLNVWYLNFFGAQSQAVLPYAQDLHLFPAFLQQLDMESLGKSVRLDGTAVGIDTGGVVWGSAGTNGQHSFHQLLHQGTRLVPADFIAAAASHWDDPARHRHLLSNCFAQGQALMQGKSLDEAREELRAQGLDDARVEALAPHKVIPGNRPSNTLMMPRLTPETLGALVAAYEHKVYVQSIVLQINAFDQWGVELGKILSKGVSQALETGTTKGLDPSTEGLLHFVFRHA